MLLLLQLANSSSNINHSSSRHQRQHQGQARLSLLLQLRWALMLLVLLQTKRCLQRLLLWVQWLTQVVLWWGWGMQGGQMARLQTCGVMLQLKSCSGCRCAAGCCWLWMGWVGLVGWDIGCVWLLDELKFGRCGCQRISLVMLSQVLIMQSCVTSSHGKVYHLLT